MSTMLAHKMPENLNPEQREMESSVLAVTAAGISGIRPHQHLGALPPNLSRPELFPRRGGGGTL